MATFCAGCFDASGIKTPDELTGCNQFFSRQVTKKLGSEPGRVLVLAEACKKCRKPPMPAAQQALERVL